MTSEQLIYEVQRTVRKIEETRGITGCKATDEERMVTAVLHTLIAALRMGRTEALGSVVVRFAIDEVQRSIKQGIEK